MDIKQEKDVEVVKFEDVVKECIKLHDEKITQEEFEEWCDRIYFKTYIPIEDKIEVLNEIIFEEEFSDDLNLKVLQLELYKFYKILIEKYTNISVKRKDMTIENYNIVYSLLGNWILTICGIDYQKTMDILKDYMNYNNISLLINTANVINNTSFDEYMKDQKEMFEWLKSNKNVVKEISQIVVSNNPIMNNLKTEIQKDVIKNINKKE